MKYKAIICFFIIFSLFSCNWQPVDDDLLIQVQDERAPSVSIIAPQDDEYFYSEISITGTIVDDALADNDRNGFIYSISYSVANDVDRRGSIVRNADDVYIKDSSYGSGDIIYDPVTGAFSIIISTIQVDGNDSKLNQQRVTITITVVDGNNNSTFKDIRIVKSEGPYIDLDEPGTTVLTFSPSDLININGTIGNSQQDQSNLDEIAELRWRVTTQPWNGYLDLTENSVHFNNGTGIYGNLNEGYSFPDLFIFNPATRTFSTSFDLPFGTFSILPIEIKAIDLNGNVSTVFFNMFTDEAGPVLDFYLPHLSNVNNLLNSADMYNPGTINSGELYYKFGSADAISVLYSASPEIMASVIEMGYSMTIPTSFVNDDTAPFDNPINITGNLVAAGENTLIIRAVNDNGNESRYTFKIYGDDLPPVITINSFEGPDENGATTDEQYLRVGEYVLLDFSAADAGNGGAISGIAASSVPVIAIDGQTVGVESLGGNQYRYLMTSALVEERTVNLSITGIQDNVGQASSATQAQAGNSLTFYAGVPVFIVNAISSNNGDASQAKEGETIELRFTSPRELESNPVVTIGLSAPITMPDPVGLTYTAEYIMQAGDAQGFIPYTLNGTDAAGNVFTPVAQASSINYDNLDPGAPVFTGVTDENDNTPTWTWTAGSGASEYQWGYSNNVWEGTVATLEFTAASPLSDGPHTLWIQSLDAAGNNSPAVSSSIEIDADPPEVSSITYSEITITTTGTVVVTVVFDEGMETSVNPVITGTPIGSGTDPGVVDQGNGSWTDAVTYETTFDITSNGTFDGRINFNVSGAEDDSGNTQISADSSPDLDIDIDETGPTVTNFTFSPAAVDTDDTVNVNIYFNEEMSSFPSPTVTPLFTGTGTGPDITQTDSGWVNDQRYWIEYSIVSNGTCDGTVDIEVSGARDESWNMMTTANSPTDLIVVIDEDPPSVLSFTPDIIAIVNTADIELSLVFDEDMNQGIAPVISPNFTGAGSEPTYFVSTAGSWTNSVTYVITYQITNEGTYIGDLDFGVSGAEDAAGNTQIAANTIQDVSLDLDATPPNTTGITPSPTSLFTTGDVSLTITYDEDMDTGIPPSIVLTFTGTGIDPTYPIQIAGSWTNNRTYDITYRITSSGTFDGSLDFGVSDAEDVAGNTQNSANSSTDVTIDIDETAPDVVSVIPSPASLTATGDVEIEIIYNEDMNQASTPIITPTPSGNGTVPTPSIQTAGSWTNATTYTITYTYTSNGSYDGTISYEVTGAEDLAGNTQSTGNSSPDVSFAIDETPPSVSSAVPTPASLTTTGDVTLVITYNEDMDQLTAPTISPTFSVNPSSPTQSIQTAGSWTSATVYEITYTYTSNGTYTGTLSYEITGADDLTGNTQSTGNSSPDISIVIDETSPSVTSVIPAPASLTTTGDVTLVITYNEGMDQLTSPTISPTFSVNPSSPTQSIQTAGSWTSASTYEITYTYTSNGTYTGTLSYEITGAEDLAGNTQSTGNSNPDVSFDIDEISPSVDSVIPAPSSLTTTGDVTLVITYNEDMDQLTSPTISPTFSVVPSAPTQSIQTAGSWTSATIYEITYTYTSNGTYTGTLSYEITGAEDLAGNTQSTGNSNPDVSFTIDETAPDVLSIVFSPVSLSDTGEVTVTVTYDKDMDEGLAPVLAVTFNGTGTEPTYAVTTLGVWGSATEYSIGYTVTNGGTYNGTLNVNASLGEDLSGNTQNAGDSFSDLSIIFP